MSVVGFIHTELSARLDALVQGRLWLQVLIALVLGALVGAALGPDLHLVSPETAATLGNWFALPGTLFLAVIAMVVIPLAASSIILGIVGAGGGDALRSIGLRLGVFVLATTFLGVVVGAGMVELLFGGPAPVSPETAAQASERSFSSIAADLPSAISALIPRNVAASLVEQDMLAIIVFSIFIGVAVISANNRDLTKPLVALAEAVLEVSMTVIRHAMRFAPIAVFGLIAETTATNGLETLRDLAIYTAAVLLGLLVLLAAFLLIVAIYGRMNPLVFMRVIVPVQLLAFSTSSSAAVMPLTMKTAVERLGVAPAVAGAVVPLAATVNMAGTALYQSAAIVFLASASGTPLSTGDLALIMATLVGASIGAPAAPGASLAVLSATAANFGVPLEGLALIFGVDRLLDMARTAVNVTGDLVACRVLAVTGPAKPKASDAAGPSLENSAGGG